MKVAFSLFCLVMLLTLTLWRKKLLQAKLRQISTAYCPGILLLYVHNCESHIEGIIRDLIDWRQLTGNCFELVVVDRGSSDCTARILEKLNYPYQKFYLLDEEEFKKTEIDGLNLKEQSNVATFYLQEPVDFAGDLAKIKKIVLNQISVARRSRVSA
ncbi:hypothetical protein [Zhaonella formicivorans]|jgi:hypothetical protein|uniref:hypothetical protein n=1 Tax=Zhaonella formicivorans TaxID=2528593 RepID=UPI0010D1EDD6|nr:hypothetical protein [Zhaonella formicivorans]